MSVFQKEYKPGVENFSKKICVYLFLTLKRFERFLFDEFHLQDLVGGEVFEAHVV